MGFSLLHTRNLFAPVALASLCSCAAGPYPAGPPGEMRVGLFGEGSSGQIYRLHGVFTVDGETNLFTETLPEGTTSISTTLAVGPHTVELEDGWVVDQLLANGVFQETDAELASPVFGEADFTIEAGATSLVTYTFIIEGEGVPLDLGQLDIDTEFDDADACPDMNMDGFCDACGDDVITFGEDCEGADLGGQTCFLVNPAFPVGTLSCTDECAFDTAACAACPDQSRFECGQVGAFGACEPFATSDDELVFDSVEGLTWARVPEPSELNFADANAACAARGMRLPDVGELESIVDLAFTPTAMPCVFDSGPSDSLWTATEVGFNSAFVVHFSFGGTGNDVQTNDYGVRCVL